MYSRKKSNNKNNCHGDLIWVPAENGSVPTGAIAGGREKDNPLTFVGRVRLQNKDCIGRIVPTHKACYANAYAMEHKRSHYEALVNPTKQTLVWQKDFFGHVPDTAIGFRSNNGTKDSYYIGRVKLPNDTTVPGHVVPKHGGLHCNYDSRDSLQEDYDVLCKNTPCSLTYLAGRVVRKLVREKEREHNAKYSTRLTNAVLALERLVFTMWRRNPRRRRESREEKLELPKTLIAALMSPKCPNTKALETLDFNTIMANCCPPEYDCCCQMWVDVTLQGLY